MKQFYVRLLILVVTLPSLATAQDKKSAREPEVDGRKLSEWVVLLHSPDVVDRQGAVLALGKMGPPAVPYLAEALSDKKIVNVRLWAAWGLRKIGPGAKGAVPQLEAALKDELGIVRIEAARALWAVAEHKSAIPTFIELLKHKEANVRWSAAEQLGKIGPKAKAAIPALKEALNDTGVAEFGNPFGVERKPVDRAAANALKRIDPDGSKKAGIQ